MKINEKHLTSFASSSSTADKEGYLNKRGEVNKSFQRRWFVLKGNLLFYYEKKGDSEPAGVIILEGCTIELAVSDDKFSFELAFLGSGTRTYILAADTQEEMEDWMKALACTGYDYMKCAIVELQRQMDELDAVKATKCAAPPARKAAETASKRSEIFDMYGDRHFHISDEFESFALIPDETDAPTRRARTFEQMHQEFGVYIQTKIAEGINLKNTLKY